MYEFEVHRGKDKQWYIRLVQRKNGQTVLDGEGYTRKWSAERAVKKLSKRFGVPWRVVS